MVKTSAIRRILAVVLSLFALIATVPFSLAEVITATPLGVIVTPGTVTVGRNVAPTGTTIFSGDKISTSGKPALINFSSGSRIEMTQATATFSRVGKALVVTADKGLLRLHFLKGEEVEIRAGNYTFTALGTDSAHSAELGLNGKGDVVLTPTEGIFSSLNKATGARTEVSPDRPLVAVDQAAKSGMSGAKTAAIVVGVGAAVATSIGFNIVVTPPPPKSSANR
ncbi:MAG: hypothetical protein ABSH28_21270 [Acidobacteriota bacterium]|jgi:hypothetical protein